MSEYYAVEADVERQNQLVAATHGDATGRFLHRVRYVPGPIDEIPELEWQLARGNKVFDWLWNINAATLLSERARSVIEPLVGAKDWVEWLPATVRTTDGTPLKYWVPNFPEPLHVYDDELTTFGPGGSQIPLPGQWGLSVTKADGHRVFALPDRGLLIIVSGPVKEAIQAAGLSGISITRCPTG